MEVPLRTGTILPSANSDNTATTLYTNPWDARVTGGYQRFPDDGSRIVVNFVSATEETDAINLHNP